MKKPNLKKTLMVLAVCALCFNACTEPRKEMETDDWTESQNASTSGGEYTERSFEGSEEELSTAEEFRANLNRQLDKNKLDIEEMKGETRNLKKDARKEYEEKISKLEKKNDALRSKLDSYREESGEEWTEFKRELKKEANDIGASIEKMTNTDKKRKKYR